MPISVVIPLASLQQWPQTLLAALQGDQVVIVCPDAPPVDPGSALYIQAPRSRGGQVASGIAACQHSCIWVLHADTADIDAARRYLEQTADSDTFYWGRFDVRIARVPWVPELMNLRSRLTRICTGDQGMFFSRAALEVIGGFPAQPLMEDIEVSKRLRRVLPGTFLAPRVSICSDGQRWLREGWMATIVYMWWLRIRYFFGASAAALYREYYQTDHD